MPGSQHGGGGGGTGTEVYIQASQPVTSAKALWLPTDADGHPTGAIYLQIPPPAPPGTPSGLGATAGSATTVNLAWTDNSSDETSFSLQRATASSFASPTTFTLSAGATTYGDTGLTSSTTYYYRVRAVRGTSVSDWSATASVTTPSAPFDMLALSPSGWWKADALSLNNNDPVTSWTDSSGNTRPLTDDAISANRPTFKTNVQNSLPGLLFDGSANYLKMLAAMSVSQPLTVSMVINQTAGSGNVGIFDAAVGRVAFGWGLSSNSNIEIFAGSGVMGAAQSQASGLHLWTFIANGASSSIRKDRAVHANANTNIGTNALNRAQIGKFNGTGSTFTGYVHELVVLPGQPDPTGFENYLRTKWGTP